MLGKLLSEHSRREERRKPTLGPTRKRRDDCWSFVRWGDPFLVPQLRGCCIDDARDIEAVAAWSHELHGPIVEDDSVAEEKVKNVPPEVDEIGLVDHYRCNRSQKRPVLDAKNATHPSLSGI